MELNGEQLTIEEVCAVAEGQAEAALAADAAGKMERSRAVVERLAAGDAPVYGVNTGVGLLADVRIAPANCSAMWCVRIARESAIRCRARKCAP
jgi:histidine ammonia-lyase